MWCDPLVLMEHEKITGEKEDMVNGAGAEKVDFRAPSERP